MKIERIQHDILGLRYMGGKSLRLKGLGVEGLGFRAEG